MTWISVKDRLPDDDEFTYSDGYYNIMYWGVSEYDGGIHEMPDWHINGHNKPGESRAMLKMYASHWMPLPARPTETE